MTKRKEHEAGADLLTNIWSDQQLPRRDAESIVAAPRKRQLQKGKGSAGQAALQAKQKVAQWKLMPGCSGELQPKLKVSLGVQCLRWDSNRQLCNGPRWLPIYTRAFNPFAVGCRQTLEIFLFCLCPAGLTELGRCLLPVAKLADFVKVGSQQVLKLKNNPSQQLPCVCVCVGVEQRIKIT